MFQYNICITFFFIKKLRTPKSPGCIMNRVKCERSSTKYDFHGFSWQYFLFDEVICLKNSENSLFHKVILIFIICFQYDICINYCFYFFYDEKPGLAPFRYELKKLGHMSFQVVSWIGWNASRDPNSILHKNIPC